MWREESQNFAVFCFTPSNLFWVLSTERFDEDRIERFDGQTKERREKERNGKKREKNKTRKQKQKQKGKWKER